MILHQLKYKQIYQLQLFKILTKENNIKKIVSSNNISMRNNYSEYQSFRYFLTGGFMSTRSVSFS